MLFRSEARDPGPLWVRMLPPDSALGSFPSVELEAALVPAFLHGQAVSAPACPEGALRVYGPDGALLGLGLGQRARIRPQRLLHADPARTRVLPA